MQTYLGLGSNLGNKEDNIQLAMQLINTEAGQVLRQSSFYYSAPMGFESDNQFVNAVVLIDTELEPLVLLHRLQAIEKVMGREHKSVDGIYQDRIIDIDILLYGNYAIETDELTIPHPHIFARDFVFKPLSELMGIL